MLTLTTVNELRQELNQLSPQLKIGFVPTMGALHLGHQSLIEKAIAQTDFVVVSIFVNPLQFAENEDFGEYPRQLEQDQQLCQQLGVNLLFAPSNEEMNTDNEDTTMVIPPSSMTSVLCGKYRQGHFEGVATIVTKLLNLIRPNIAYFGQKDAQQVAIIQRLVQDLQMPVKIQPCPIIREKSGLARSSRNQYLSDAEKQEATALFASLDLARQNFLQGDRNVDNLINLVTEKLSQTSLQLQYVEIVEPLTLQPLTEINSSGLLAIAVYCGQTRLIDNMILTTKKPIIAIDGPAGAGKSTVSRRVAQKLGLIYLDTGAMYRAITWLVLEEKIAISDEEAIAKIVKSATLELIPNDDLKAPVTVKINGNDVTTAIRTPHVTAQVSQIASQKAVRETLVKLQQDFGEQGGIVAEGRDIGTNVFPQAELKIYLTASVSARAKRRSVEDCRFQRSSDLQQQGETNINLIQLEQEIAQRDHLDSTRQLSPLQKAEDAKEINTDNLTIEQVTATIINLYQKIA